MKELGMGHGRYVLIDLDNGGKRIMDAWAGQLDAKQIVISLSKHKTTENLEKTGAFTISFADERTVAQSDYFGLGSRKGHR